MHTYIYILLELETMVNPIKNGIIPYRLSGYSPKFNEIQVYFIWGLDNYMQKI